MLTALTGNEFNGETEMCEADGDEILRSSRAFRGLWMIEI